MYDLERGAWRSHRQRLVEQAKRHDVQHVEGEGAGGAQFFRGPSGERAQQAAIHVAAALDAHRGNAQGMLHEAAKCCQPTSGPRTTRARRMGTSTMVKAKSICGRQRSNSRCASRCSASGRRIPVECRPSRMMAPMRGSSQFWISSSGGQPPAIAHPFQEPAEAPTTRSGFHRPLRTFQKPASQAANIPPAESTRAVGTKPS